MLARHLGELHHERVALVRHNAYRMHLPSIGRALQARGLRVDEVAPSEVGGMSEILLELMARPERPTVVIAPPAHAQALLRACDAAGLSVPDDLSIVSVGGSGPPGRNARRALSYLAIDPHRLGRAAGAAMLGWLAGARPTSSLRVEHGSFVARATTGPAPKRA
jgi:DNA-binding LacI/PurR family transcriptional regulator